jgi:hypothetical protein
MNQPTCPTCTLVVAADGTPMHARACSEYTGKLRDGWNPSMTATGARWRVRTADGALRTAELLRDADTFWTVPARVAVRGRTVTGHVYANTLSAVGEWRFTPYAYLRNADALPEWPLE